MNAPRIFYESNGLVITYSPSMEGYFVAIRDNPQYFFPRETISDFTSSAGLDLLDKLDNFDMRIPLTLKKEKMSPSSISEAFKEVMDKENAEFHKFMNSRNE